MTGFFFGPADQALFGFFNPTDSEGRAVLICPPWGVEYEYAHRALRVLAQRLAFKGTHVLRFDYSGTGDSWGDDTDADLERWLEDLDLAARELRSISGEPRLDLVGLRLGATIALRAERRFGGVDRMVLWDPITNGGSWKTELQALARRRRATYPDRGSAEGFELAHYEVSSRFMDQVSAIDLDSPGHAPNATTLLLSTQVEHDRGHFRGVLDGARDTEFRHLVQPPPWKEDTSIWGGHVPVEALTTIVEWLSRR
jgi:uncharacterized protein